jgi:3-isopropylmalate dehydratase small subunit
MVTEMEILRGAAYLFGNNIDTDQIYPGRFLELTDHSEIGQHAMEGADPGFPGRFKKGGFIVAGSNFGCGSSREHAVITLKNAGVAAILAKSFARIFFRNCINLGLPAIMLPEIDTLGITEGSELTLDLPGANLFIGTKTCSFPPLSGEVLEIIKAGGVFSLYGARAVN